VLHNCILSPQNEHFTVGKKRVQRISTAHALHHLMHTLSIKFKHNRAPCT
jgi:hypothetical protein